MSKVPETGTEWTVDPRVSESPHAGVVARRRGGEEGWSPDDLTLLEGGDRVTVTGLHLRGAEWNCYARCDTPRGELLLPLFQFSPGGWLRRQGGGGE